MDRPSIPAALRLPRLAIAAGSGGVRRKRAAEALRGTWVRLRDGVEADRDRLVLWLPPLVGTGILLYFALRAEPPAWAGLAPMLLLLGLLPFMRRSRIAHAAVAGGLAVSLGFSVAILSAHGRAPLPPLPRKAALVSGRLLAVDLMPDGRRRLTLGGVGLALAAPPADGTAADIAQTGRTLRIRLRPDDATPLQVGDRVRVRAMLRAPSPPDYPGGRDPQRDAFFSGLGGSGRALSPVAVLAPADGRGIGTRLRRAREAVAARILLTLPGPRGAVAATLLTGLSSEIPQADRDAFAASGLAHLLAVAGLHLGVVMLIGLTVVRSGLAAFEWAALRLPCREIAALSALSLGAGYMLLTGLHLPGLRSLAMAAVAMLGLVVGRRAVSLRGLAVAALLIMLASPATVLDVGFQMSFAAVLALLAGYEAARPLTRRLHGPDWRGRLSLHLFQLFFTSLLAGAASLPYAAFHFGRVQFYFVLANLLAVPITTFFVMPQGLLALLAMPFGLDWLFLRMMGAGIDLILMLAHGVAALPAASLPVPAPPAWGLATVSAGLVWLCLWRRRWRLLALLPIALGCASPWLARPPDVLVSADAALIALREPGALLLEQGQRADPLTLEDWQRDWARPGPPTDLPDAGAAAADTVCNPDACLLERGRTLLLLRSPPGRDRDAAAADTSQAGASQIGASQADTSQTNASQANTSQANTSQAGALRPEDCRGVSVLVSPAPSRGACSGVRRIDRFTVWRDGPQAVWLAPGGIRVWSARADRGARPWVPEPPGRRPRPTLPLAPSE